ncbi:MAG TPA: hypothetical protein VHM88_08805 [Candidatus Acidoferrales bacterium]|nr:hypothetical protein [Candidatus Acidoferrales bacterium]
MNVRTGALVFLSVLVLAGCNLETVTVQIPPEVDLKGAGIKSVAIAVADLPNDPAPVGVLLRSETSARFRELLPALTLVETPQTADAILQMNVANHGVGPAHFQTRAPEEQGEQAHCQAWQEAFLLVEASVLTKGNPSPRWEGALEKRDKIDLSCTPFFGPVGVVSSPAVSDPALVSAIVDDLGRRLVGYTRQELRPRRTTPPVSP